MKFTPVPITGAGLVTAAGRGVEPAWAALCAGRSLLAPDTDPELTGFPPIQTARCARIDPESVGADRRAARTMGHHTHMLLAAVHDLVTGAPAVSEMEEEEIAFFAGMDSVDPGKDDLMGAVRDSRDRVDLVHFFSEGMDTIPPLWPLSMVNAIGFSQAAIQHRWRGENAVFSAGPEAAARAACEAADSICTGKARLALCAGVSGVVSARMLARAQRRGVWPQAGGLGEGAGVIRIEKPEEIDRSKILGWLKGYSSVRALKKRGGLARAVQTSAEGALASAALTPDKVDLLVIHGEGESRADGAEAQAIRALLGGHKPWGLATKGVFGHLWGGSTVLDLIMAMK
ncbi:MAG: hypothetical protein J4F48_08540, partial [Nitrospinae bacterium]|nr:hypothetical protein [Nitrospinota bacterium]